MICMTLRFVLTSLLPIKYLILLLFIIINTTWTGATKLQIEMCYLSVLVMNPKINLNRWSVLALLAECRIVDCFGLY